MGVDSLAPAAGRNRNRSYSAHTAEFRLLCGGGLCARPGRAVRPISSGVTSPLFTASSPLTSAFNMGVTDPLWPLSWPGVILRPRSGAPACPAVLFAF